MVDVNMVLQVSIGPEFERFSLGEVRAALEGGLRGLLEYGSELRTEDEAIEGSWGAAARQWLEALPWPQNQVAEVAAINGGVVSRAEVYRVMGLKEGQRGLRGFTRPYTRIARKLQADGLLDSAFDFEERPPVTAIYAGNSVAAAFRLEAEIVEPLRSLLNGRDVAK